MAVPMHSFVLSLLTPITVAVLPVLRKHFINGEKGLFKKTLNDTFRTCTFLVTPCMFGLVFFAKESLGLVFPKESATIAAPLLAITSVGMLFSIWHIIANTALEAGGNIKAPLISMLISCAVKLSVSYVLIGDPDYGILGAPIGTVASYATSFLISAICLYRLQRIRISVSRHFIIAAASSFFSVYAAFLFYNRSNLINDYNLRFITSVIIAILLYMILYYVFGLHRVLQKKHRQNVQNSGRIII
jgi:stage V sporulation protein B